MLSIAEPRREAIRESLALLFSEGFQKQLQGVVNPYGEGSPESIVLTLERCSLNNILKKRFYDLVTR